MGSDVGAEQTLMQGCSQQTLPVRAGVAAVCGRVT